MSSMKNIKKGPKSVKLDLNSKPKATKEVISIDIGSEKIKFVVGRYSKNKLILEKIFTVNTPEGSTSDGNILNTMVLSKTIEKAIKDILGEKSKIKEVNITSNSTTIINREIIVPKAAEDELDTLVRYEIAQYLPINLDDYILQYNVVDEVKQEEVSKFKVLVITYPNKLAKQYYEVINTAKLKANILDVTFNSIRKLLANTTSINEREYNKEDSIALIDMGAETLNVNIYNGGQMDFTRIIKSGGSLIDRDIARKLGITLKEAEVKKIGLSNINYSAFEENSEELLVNNTIANIVDEWVEELNRIIQFYRNKKMGNKIDRIYIYGGNSNLKGIDEYLASKMNLSVERLSSFNNVVINDNINKEELNLYLNAIGSIIRL